VIYSALVLHGRVLNAFEKYIDEKGKNITKYTGLFWFYYGFSENLMIDDDPEEVIVDFREVKFLI
jgi:hypothetical protein